MSEDAPARSVLLAAPETSLVELERRLSEHGIAVRRTPPARLLASLRPAPDALIVADAPGLARAADVVLALGDRPEMRLRPVVLLVPEGATGTPDEGGALELFETVPATIDPAILAERVHALVRARRVIEQEETRMRRLESLFDVTRSLNSTLDSGAILYMIARQLSEAMELVRCSFIVPDLTHGVGHVIACKDDPNIHSLEINLANYPEIIQVLRSGQRVIIADVDQDPIMAGIRKFADVFRDQSIMTLPLSFHDEIIGVLQIRKRSQRQGFTAREIEYGELLASSAASALKNAQLFEDIEKHNHELRRRKRELEQLSDELRRKNAELIELQQLKEDFTAMVVHDLRSPLMIVQGVLDLLHRKAPDHDLRSLIEDGVGVTKKILALIGNLLEVARLESGEVELQRELVALVALIAEVAAPYQVMAKTRGMELLTELEDLPAVALERRGIGQVIDNLLSNAFKYTPDGGRVEVRASLTADGGTVVLRVEDNGPGIDATDLPTIFKKFRRGRHDSRKKGTGLGLTIVNLIVTKHGGTVDVESKPGEGTRFTVRLPVVPLASA